MSNGSDSVQGQGLWVLIWVQTVCEGYQVSKVTTWRQGVIVGRICNNFEKNRAFYDKSMKLGTWLVYNKTKKIRVSATPKMPSNGRHLVFPKWPPFSTYSL